MTQEQRIIEMAVSDTITEKPIEFSVNQETFSIYPPTFGKMQVLSKYYLMLEIDEKALADEPHVEMMRICEAKTDIVCTLMAITTFRDKEDILNNEKIRKRADFFKWNTLPADFSTILLALLTQVHYENFITSIRLTKTLRINTPKG